jgi:flagellar hook assembly protein FlgD
VKARLTVFDIGGRAVRAFDIGALGPGAHAVEWDGHDGAGVGVGAGLYFARLEAAGRTLVRQFTIVR